MVMSWLNTFVIIAIGYFVYAFVRRRIEWYKFQKFAKANGCGKLPMSKSKLPWSLDVFFELLRFKGDILDDFIAKRYELNGNISTYGVSSALDSGINTIDPKNIQTVLALNFKDYELGPIRKGNLQPLSGEHGIFTTDGKAWEGSRALLRPQFSRDQISDFEALEEHMKNLFKVLPIDSTTGWTDEIDLMPLFYRFSLDTATEFLFGDSVNSQLTQATSEKTDSAFSEQDPDEMDFAKAFAYAQEYCAWRFRLNSLYWLISSKKFQKSCQIAHDFTDRFVRNALDPKRHYASNNTQDYNEKYFDQKPAAAQKEKFVLLDALAQETQDPKVLRDQILAVLLAGRDTTASLLSWVFFNLPRHPHVLARLREEVAATFGNGEEITFTSLKSMKYMRHVINETLRLYPVVPFNARVAIRDTVLPVGGGPDRQMPIAVKKGWSVGYPVYVMHRRKDIWGDDALEFNPDRWEGRKSGWEFLPFNGGPRICLGQQYALNEASFAIVRILQQFSEIESTDPQEKVLKTIALTMAPGNGVKVRLRRRAQV